MSLGKLGKLGNSGFQSGGGDSSNAKTQGVSS